VVVALIDLDRMGPVGGAPTRRDRLGARPVTKAFAAAALLLVAAAGGSAPAGGRGLEKVLTVATTSQSRYVIGADALYLSTVDADFSGHVERHALDGSRSRVGDDPDWSIRFPSSLSGLLVRPAAHVLLVSGFAVAATAVDTRTGRELWRNGAGMVMAASDAIVLLAMVDEDDHEVRDLQAVRLRTGERVWSREVHPAADWHFVGATTHDGLPRYVVIVDVVGTVTTVRVSDGAVVATRDLGVEPRRTDDGYRDDFVEVSAVDDNLYVAERPAGTASLTAYRVSDLAPLWRASPGAVGRLSPCGPVVCVNDDSGTTAAVDARTGQLRWTTDRWVLIRGTVGDGPLLASPGQAAETVLLDARTGRQVGQVGTASDIEGSARLLLRRDATDPGRTFVADLNASGSGGSRLLGQLDATTSEPCTATGAYVACPSVLNTTSVWRVLA
jgi:outer membrane protein assembly factor BamB